MEQVILMSCISKPDVRMLGRLLEDRMSDDQDIIYGRDKGEEVYLELPGEERKALDALSGRIDDKYHNLFVKVKSCSCMPPEDFEKWEKQFRKGMIPWR